ncbi:MAG: DUF4258 domain-containing protein [Planctomycetota bacterium]
MNVLQRIQHAVRTEQYELSVHAFEEAEDDEFLIVDIEHALLNGKIAKKYTHDPKGTRYTVRGPALDDRLMIVVCRFCERTGLLILTVFRDFED